MISIYDYGPMLVYFTVLAAVFGAVMGSFLNCAAWRIARGESFLKGRSRCPHCGHRLTATELVPVLSWLAQRGKCRSCGAKISVRYPLTELVFSVVSVCCLLRFDLTVLCLRNYIFLCCLFCLSLADLECLEIPDGCHIICIAAWTAAVPFTFISAFDTVLHLLSALLFGGGILGLSVLLDRALGRESLGGGDVKLLAVTGLYLGPVAALFSLILACVTGLLFYLLLSGRGKKGQPFPFGPSISAGAALMLLFGEPLVRWYLNLLGI